MTFVIAAFLAIAAQENPPARVKAPEALANLEYRSIGPAAGGRVSRAVGVPGDRRTYYAATASGGVWKSIDAGSGPVGATPAKCETGEPCGLWM